MSCHGDVTYDTQAPAGITAQPISDCVHEGAAGKCHSFTTSGYSIGVALAGILGGRMASAEGGSVKSGVEYGEGGCPLPSRSGVSGGAS